MTPETVDSVDAVHIRRAPGGPLVSAPVKLVLTAESFGIDSRFRLIGHLRFSVPNGWTVASMCELSWTVEAFDLDPDAWVEFRLDLFAHGRLVQSFSRVLPVQLDLQSTFDSLNDPFPFRNRASEIGEISPKYHKLEMSFSGMPGVLKRLLFQGIYSDIVYLRLEGPSRGGVCIGMTRWALGRSLGDEPAPRSSDEALQRIIVLHGRQMTDRSLLASLPWFLRGSSRNAFHAVRRDLLKDPITDRVLDIGVPKLWRRDITTAIIREGHSVVPYRLRQANPGYGEIDVYDPNRPQRSPGDEPQTIHFQLESNRYRYRAMVDFTDSKIGMIAVRQRDYVNRGTAYLATIGSAGLLGARLVGDRFRR